MAVTVASRPLVTRAFLDAKDVMDGYFCDDGRLYRVLAVGEDTPEGVVLVEDCAMPPPDGPAISLERKTVEKCRVVAWPPSLR